MRLVGRVGQKNHRLDEIGSERPDTMYLNNRLAARPCKMRHCLRNTSVGTDGHLFENAAIKSFSRAQVPSPLNHRNVLILGMAMWRNDRAIVVGDADDIGSALLVPVSLDLFDELPLSVHRNQNMVWLRVRLLGMRWLVRSIFLWQRFRLPSVRNGGRDDCSGTGTGHEMSSRSMWLLHGASL